MSDGIDWINIYSKGETKLGRDLSNFAALSVETLDGSFASLEGYWYWLSVPPSLAARDALRYQTGHEAKFLGQSLRRGSREVHYTIDPLFKLKIVHAMVGKLILHPALFAALKDSSLPLRHYYVYGGVEVEPKSGQWIVPIWEMLRALIKSESS